MDGYCGLEWPQPVESEIWQKRTEHGVGPQGLGIRTGQMVLDASSRITAVTDRRLGDSRKMSRGVESQQGLLGWWFKEHSSAQCIQSVHTLDVHNSANACTYLPLQFTAEKCPPFQYLSHLLSPHCYQCNLAQNQENNQL